MTPTPLPNSNSSFEDVQLVTHRDEAIRNIHTYLQNLDAMQSNMAKVKAWYALKTPDGWVFGPSKFIGYKDITLEMYQTHSTQDGVMSGTHTERALSHMAKQLPARSTIYSDMLSELREFCGRYNRQVKSNVKIYLLRPEDANMIIDDEDIVDQAVTMVRQMSALQKVSFLRRIGQLQQL